MSNKILGLFSDQYERNPFVHYYEGWEWEFSIIKEFGFPPNTGFKRMHEIRDFLEMLPYTFAYMIHPKMICAVELVERNFVRFENGLIYSSVAIAAENIKETLFLRTEASLN